MLIDKLNDHQQAQGDKFHILVFNGFIPPATPRFSPPKRIPSYNIPVTPKFPLRHLLDIAGTRPQGSNILNNT